MYTLVYDHSMTIPHITCEHFLKLQQTPEKEHVVLDIRDNADFDTGHILGSLHIPHKELDVNIHTLIPEKNKKVIVIVGPTQEQDIEKVHAQLVALGYTNVEFLAGGFDKYCDIAPVEIEPELLLGTPEEKGFTGDDLVDIDPKDNEPQF